MARRPLKRPRLQDLGDGALRELNEALHELHRAAQHPPLGAISSGVLLDGDQEATPSRTRVWNLFAQPRLPDPEFMGSVVLFLVEKSTDDETEQDKQLRRFRTLWEAAAAEVTQPKPAGAEGSGIQLREDMDPQLIAAWMDQASKPNNSARRRPATDFDPQPGPVLFLQRALWGLYVDAGMPPLGEVAEGMGLHPNSRETLRRGFSTPHRWPQDRLRKFVWFLAGKAGYPEPNRMSESIDIARIAAVRQDRESTD